MLAESTNKKCNMRMTFAISVMELHVRCWMFIKRKDNYKFSQDKLYLTQRTV